MSTPVEIYTVKDPEVLHPVGAIYMDQESPPFNCRAVAIPALWLENGTGYAVIAAPGEPCIPGRLRFLEELWKDQAKIYFSKPSTDSPNLPK